MKQAREWNYIIIILLLSGLALRIIAAYMYYGYPNDIACFKGWSELLFRNGLSEFYSSPEFTDYPPGYMYILYIIGAVRNACSIPMDSKLFTVIIKFPAIFFDILTGIFIYLFAAKKTSPLPATLVTALYLLNPAIIINSAVWGQVDAVYTFIIMLSLYYLMRESLFKGFSAFTCAILIKPQSLIFSPVYLFYLYDSLRKNNFDKETIIHILKSGVVCFFALFLAILPFAENFNFAPVIKQYGETLASYPYASVNAYNLYVALGANWKPVEETFLFMPYGVWGYFFIVLIVIAAFYLLYRRCNYFWVAALINFSTFMLSAKMHERYVFPSLSLFLLSFLSTARADKNKIGKKGSYIAISNSRLVLVLYMALSVTLFINCRDVLNLVNSGNDLNIIEKSSVVVSHINIGLFILSVVLSGLSLKEINSTHNFT